MNDWTILCLVVLIDSVCIHARLGFVFPFASFRPPSLHFVTKKKKSVEGMGSFYVLAAQRRRRLTVIVGRRYSLCLQEGHR